MPARLRDSVPAGMVFVPFHWGDLYSDGNAANYLTISAIGRVAKQPELKFCAVHLEKAPQPLSSASPVAQPEELAPPRHDGQGQPEPAELYVG